MGPLAGIRIVDMTTVMMGPSATQALAEMGADVIKVEAPGGDGVRNIAPGRHPGMGGLFLNNNANKRSLAVNLKRPEGRAALLRLAETADALVYNVRPAAMERLGLSYEAVAAARPDIVYLGMFGYGQDGPYATRPAYDDLIQGAAMIPALVARAGDCEPRYVPNAIADRIVGLSAVSALCAALLHRERTGRGQRIDVPMFETMTAFVLGDHMAGRTFDPPLDGGGYARLLARERRPFRTRDGYLCALLYNDAQWRSFYTAIGQAERFEADPRLTTMAARSVHIADLYAELAEIFAGRTTAEWATLLTEADVPFAPMHDFDTIFDDPHLQAIGFFRTEEHPTEGCVRRMRTPSTWSETQPVLDRPAPAYGEHSVDVLTEAGLAEKEIAALIADGVVADGAAGPVTILAAEPVRSQRMDTHKAADPV